MMHFHEDSCFIAGCKLIPTLVCKCSDPFTYSCSSHIESHRNHTPFKGDHLITFIPTSILQESNKTKVLRQLKGLEEGLIKCKLRSIDACTQLMNVMNCSLLNFIHQIEDLESKSCRIRKKILLNEPINSSLICNFKINSIDQLSIDNISKIIKKLFELKSSDIPSIENSILFAEENNKGLFIVDLNSFKFTSFRNSKNYCRFASACAISDAEYFIYGGRLSSPGSSVGYASIINLETNLEEILPYGHKRHDHSCVFKDDSVYSFGGYNLLKKLDKSTRFDLKTKLWYELSNMPICSPTSSTLFNNKIIIVGYFLNCAYIFESNSYTRNLDVKIESKLRACEKWLIGAKKIYECQNLEKVLWKEYPINIPSNKNWLPINLCYKRNQYIYIIFQPRELWRIDTISMSAVKLNS